MLISGLRVIAIAHTTSGGEFDRWRMLRTHTAPIFSCRPNCDIEIGGEEFRKTVGSYAGRMKFRAKLLQPPEFSSRNEFRLWLMTGKIVRCVIFR